MYKGIKRYSFLVIVFVISSFFIVRANTGIDIESHKNIVAEYSTDSAISYYKVLLEESEITKLDKESFYINSELASLYRIKADFSTALDFDLRALKIAESLKDDYLLGSANNSIGIDHYRNNELEQAEYYFRIGLDYRLKTDDNSAIADSYYKLAMVFDDTGKTDQAKEYFQLAISHLGNQPDCVAEADVYNGLAALYYKLQMPDSTEYFALKAMDKYFDCGNLELVSFMYMNLASLVNMQRNHGQALKYLSSGLEIADSLGLLSQLRQGYKNLSETYAYMGDYENAYKHHITYIRYKDSIFNLDKAASFQELNILYETEKKERELVEKQSEIELKNVQIAKSIQQRNLLIIIAVLFVIAIIFGYYRFSEKKKYGRILDKKNAELVSINAAKDKLFSIISHDLSSPISSYTRLTEALIKVIDKLSHEELKEYISDLNVSSVRLQALLSNLLQWSLNQSGHFEPNPQKTDIIYILDRVCESIQISADEKNIHIKKPAYENQLFLVLDEKMTETVFRNILSNAVKFSPNNSEIEILVQSESDTVKIIINDSGPGMDKSDLDKLFKYGEDMSIIGKEKEKKGSGLGLILASEFVEKNKGNIFAEINKNGGLSIIVEYPKTE
jgi:signal transduction histidine kinase